MEKKVVFGKYSKLSPIFNPYLQKRKWRMTGMAVIIICLFVVAKFALEVAFISEDYDNYNEFEFVEKADREPVWTQEDEPNVLLKMNNFQFIHKGNRTICNNITTPESSMFLLVMVNSKLTNSEKRIVIRNSWGSLRRYNQWNVRVVFLLSGEASTSEKLNIQKEASTNGDIIMGNIKDGVEQEVHTVLMGYKWALNDCRNVDYILHTAEDVYVDLFRVIERALYKTRMTALCHVLWEEEVQRNVESERYVSKEEFKPSEFPAHCNPTVNIRSFDLVENMYLGSYVVDFIHLQDVFFGIVGKTLPPFNLLDIGFEYQYNSNVVLSWARNGQYGKDQKLPWMFIVFSNSKNYKKNFYYLWRKIATVYKQLYKFEVSHNSSLIK